MVWIMFCALWLQVPETKPAGQAVPQRLRILVLECDGAVNDTRSLTACQPRVRVEDENENPVAGAIVSFTLPQEGPGGFFPGKLRSLVLRTDDKGEVTASGLVPNAIEGPFRIRVEASLAGKTAEASLTEINGVEIKPVAAKRPASRSKLLAILGVGGAAAVVAIVVASRGGKEQSTSPPPPGTTLTPGRPTVGSP